MNSPSFFFSGLPLGPLGCVCVTVFILCDHFPSFQVRMMTLKDKKSCFSSQEPEVLTPALCLCAPPSGVSRVDGHGRPDPLRFESPAHLGPHPGCVCLFGPSVQRPDGHLHLPADPGAMEPGRGAAGGLLHCHRSGLYFPLCCRLL